MGATRNNTPDPAGPAGPAGPTGPTDNRNSSNRWNLSEVDFLDPMYNGKSSVTDNPIEHAGKDTYFRDVHLFIERIKHMAAVKSADLLRNNLYICLRGTALAWYTEVLTEEQKRLVKLGSDIDKWLFALLKRFKKSPSTAMATVTKKCYTIKDARRKREPLKFAQIIIRAAKSANMPVFSQIYLIYNGLELEFRRNLTKPTEQTTIDVFLQELENNKEIW